MVYARKKRLMKQFRDLEVDIVVIDIGAGTNYHALDFFLMADIHLVVATPEPTSVLDLYRFIKLAAIRRVLACFLARSPLSDVLSNRDFTSVEEVMEVADATEAGGRDAAAATLRSFRPGLIINRASGSSQINVLYLRKILHQYVGGDLAMLGQIPEDPAVIQAVRKFLPVIEAAPESLAAKHLSAISAVVGQLVAASAGRGLEETNQSKEKETSILLSNSAFAQDSHASLPLNQEVPPASRQPACTSTIQSTSGRVA
jgi:flagellar biosynthesis protein FlhG